METALYGAMIVTIVLALYMFLSGAAFVTIYRFPGKAPAGFYSWFFAPLDWIARRVPIFGAAYNGFHQWCYQKFAHQDHET